MHEGAGVRIEAHGAHVLPHLGHAHGHPLLVRDRVERRVAASDRLPGARGRRHALVGVGHPYAPPPGTTMAISAAAVVVGFPGIFQQGQRPDARAASPYAGFEQVARDVLAHLKH